jgi:ABC-type polysaccharide/polyol phosphate transport system ATPase subunit
MASAIIVDDVWKQFRLGNATHNGDLRERFSRRFANGPVSTAEFWALKGVSFEVEQGSSLGIVGHNGSGKSTMLKMLTGILKPTKGHIEVEGRVGGLIEVGAGFHPDLTGRENIFLNASILGLSRREITRRFDEIVAFSELERFIDTPVKRYSSGMYMRLGFSVIAHTSPQILIIDEVLAVGDASFQEKCMSRIREVAAQGATVVFVSHSMDAVAKICTKALLLDSGETVAYGSSEKVVKQYGSHMTGRIAARYLADDAKAAGTESSAAVALPDTGSRAVVTAATAPSEQSHDSDSAADGAEEAVSDDERVTHPEPLVMRSVEVLNQERKPCRAYQVGDSLTIRIEYEAHREITDCIVGVGLNRIDGVVCYGPNTRTDDLLITVPKGPGYFEVTFDPLYLLADTYTVAAALVQGDALLAYRDNVCRFLVEDERTERGVSRMPHQWAHFADGKEVPPQLAQDSGAPFEESELLPNESRTAIS